MKVTVWNGSQRTTYTDTAGMVVGEDLRLFVFAPAGPLSFASGEWTRVCLDSVADTDLEEVTERPSIGRRAIALDGKLDID